MVKFRFQKLNKQAFVPEQAFDTDMGIDFRSPIDTEVLPQTIVKIPTGLRLSFSWNIEIEAMSGEFNLGMRMASKSGLATDKGIIVVGEVDQDYRGELQIILFNSSRRTFHITRGDKIAQGIVHLLPKVSVVEVSEITTSTPRGENGFGSTDV